MTQNIGVIRAKTVLRNTEIHEQSKDDKAASVREPHQPTWMSRTFSAVCFTREAQVPLESAVRKTIITKTLLRQQKRLKTSNKQYQYSQWEKLLRFSCIQEADTPMLITIGSVNGTVSR